MWTLVIVIIIVSFIYGIICDFSEDEGTFFTYFPFLLLIFLWFGMNNNSTAEINYFTKDIRKHSVIQYDEIKYGKVDSISYHVNGELVNYSQVNTIK